MDSLELQVLFAGAATASACVASVFDLRERRIPNWVTGPVLLAGLAAHTFTAHWKGLAEAAAAALLGGAIFLLFHLAGGMGAGDVKLMAACAGVTGLSGLGTLLIATGIFGALFPLVVADLTRGTGHFNVSQGAIATAAGLGGALSTTAAGLIVVKAGYSAAFLFLAAVAGAGLIGFATMMPETLRRAQDEGRLSG